MATIKKDYSSAGIPGNYERSNPIPLDTTEVWYRLSDAENYARTSGTAYVGQILTVVENGISTPYVINDEKGKLAPIEIHKTVPTNQTSAEGVRYYKLLTITPTGLAHGDMFYEFFVSARSNENTTIRIAASTTATDKHLTNVSITYDGNLHTYITAYRFREVIDNVSTDRIELWGKLSSWNMWDIFQKTYDRHENISLTWNIEQADALPTNAYENIEITALSWLGNAATATKATQDASGNIFTDYYATISSLNELREEALNNTISRWSFNFNTPYGVFVVGLCEAPTSANGINSSAYGDFYFARNNGLYAPYTANVEIAGCYGAVDRVYCRYTTSGFKTFKPCVFTYNGTRYAGFEIYVQPADPTAYAHFVGHSSIEPVCILVRTDEGEGKINIKNADVQNSIRYDTVQRFASTSLDVVNNYYEYKILTNSRWPGFTFAVKNDLLVDTGIYKVTDSDKYSRVGDSLLDGNSYGTSTYNTNSYFYIENSLTGSTSGNVYISPGVYKVTSDTNIQQYSITHTINSSNKSELEAILNATTSNSAYTNYVLNITEKLTMPNNTYTVGYYYPVYNSYDKRYNLSKISQYSSYYPSGSVFELKTAITVKHTNGTTLTLNTGNYSVSSDGLTLSYHGTIQNVTSSNALITYLAELAAVGNYFKVTTKLTDTDIKAGLYTVGINNEYIKISNAASALDSISGYKDITSAPTDKGVSYPVNVKTAITLNGVTIPASSKGMFFGAGADDATLIVTSPNGNTYTAYRNGTTWQSCKNISSDSGSSSNTTTLSSLGITVTATSINDGINYLKNVTSNVQTQLNNKLTYTADTTDIGSGSSLETGKLYLVIE